MSNPFTALLETLAELDTALGDAVGGLVRDDAGRGMTDAGVLELVAVVESIGRRADAARVVAAGAIDERCLSDLGSERLSARHGCGNAVELLTRLTRVSGATAADRIRMAATVATDVSLSGELLPAPFPAIRDALADGTIGVDAISAIARTLGPIARRCDPRELAAAEAELVGAATGTGPDEAPPCSADQTRIQAKEWSLVLDPDGPLPRDERAMRKRFFRMGRELDGIVSVSGGLTLDVAARLERLLHAQMSPRVTDPPLPTVAVGGSVSASEEEPAFSGPTFVEVDDGHDDGSSLDLDSSDEDDADLVVPFDPRTRPQKMHDALAAIFDVAARAAESPSIGGAPPTLLVTIAAADLGTDDGAAFVDGTDTALPARVARQIACSGGIQRIVFGPNGRIIELGSPSRTFTGAQRRAIHARDGSCLIPGCTVPAVWCEIHHVEEYARGGPTHTDNGVPLCWFHHRTLETNGWQIRMVDGMPETKAPYCVDPKRRWRPAGGSAARRYDALRRRRGREPARR